LIRAASGGLLLHVVGLLRRVLHVAGLSRHALRRDSLRRRMVLLLLLRRFVTRRILEGTVAIGSWLILEILRWRVLREVAQTLNKIVLFKLTRQLVVINAKIELKYYKLTYFRNNLVR
jgi:hypothetical protein